MYNKLCIRYFLCTIVMECIIRDFLLPYLSASYRKSYFISSIVADKRSLAPWSVCDGREALVTFTMNVISFDAVSGWNSSYTISSLQPRQILVGHGWMIFFSLFLSTNLPQSLLLTVQQASPLLSQVQIYI
jgi:hypothetical protein